ncbi:Asparagine synthase, glutamine-hydrolyzing [Shewanella denitrificans OS217]|uniref:asparagine synthase (glutamine-hydrolyzing) n=1 Tax=Shewanella denitrificans (strain OS217 / ATCC BAA-1090 / DSM 15013) TaxID=318161 RepID=Q12HN2_SHEDO|nr:N-acetylglutaminylglutamine amidotransferase [Shewanella denitrificans]ABE57044.1 Asparagine synthase, glutamine-hydrolyzing [Shewanella denitrificans OS217]
MCGLAGEIAFAGEADVNQVARMLTKLAPRGPDGTGVFSQGRCCFGHRRLKIIDLSEQGSQPMVDATLGLTLVFNGCIYNYRALREQLIHLGYQFFSSSDTEVILKAYDHWGESCVNQFNGMFSFAIYERDTGKVFLARDRLGIKPLYYFIHDKGLVFASSLPALLVHTEASTEIDSVALNHYMCFRAIVTEHTLFKGIKKLQPGHWMTISAAGEINQQSYWQLDNSDTEQYQMSQPSAEAMSEELWSQQLEQALYDSVRRRLEADVPVGVLLSGGLDSSLLVGLMHELGQKQIHTFSIGFDDVADELGNEFIYSDVIAEHYQTKHQKIQVNHAELLQHLPDCILAMSEPMVSHDVIGFYLLSKTVSQHVKVVQSGQGADEVFAGYHWYPPMVDASEQMAAQVYQDNYFSWQYGEYQQLVTPKMADGDHAGDFVRDYFAQCKATHAIDKALMLDTLVMLVDDPVKRVDNMTMAFGLEARVPFLDHKLVELASRMPYQLKIKDGGKYLLKQMARKLIPNQVIDRPKGYFPVPGLRNMQGPYLALAKQVFSEPIARTRGIFNLDYIDTMLASPEQQLTRFGSRLWQVTLLELWLQLHLDNR